MSDPWVIIGWLLVPTLGIVAVFVSAYFVMVVTKPVGNLFKRLWKDRYRRKWRKGLWLIECDLCHQPAHYMIITKNGTWGKGAKRCWKHKLCRPELTNTHDQKVMPVNRQTAWVRDPPPANYEDMVRLQEEYRGVIC